MTTRKTKAKDSKGNGSVAGGRFTSHPSQSARWMGHPFCCGCQNRNKRNSRFPSGMTTRKTTAVGNGGKNMAEAI